MSALHDTAVEELDDALFTEVIEEGLNLDDIQAMSREIVDRLIGRVGRLRSEREADRTVVAERVAAVQAWFDERDVLRENIESQLLSIIEAWHSHVLSLDPKAKTINLPSGASKSRAHAQAIKVEDEAAFLEWAKAHAPHLVREKVTYSPDKTAAKDALRVADSDSGPLVIDPATGAVVPGAAVEPAGRTFAVTVTEPDEVAS